MNPTLEKVIEIAALEFETPPSNLSGASTPEDVKGWDSEAQIRLAMALEHQFGISFDIEEFEGIRTLAGVANLVARKARQQSP